MNPKILEQYDKYTVINELTNHYLSLEETNDSSLKEYNYQLKNCRDKIAKLEKTIQLLKDDKIYLQKIIDRPTLSMRIMARVDVLLSYCGLKRIKKGR